jgi:hypothetical protein
VGECGDACADAGGSQARAVAGEGGGEGDDERFVASWASATSVRPHAIATRQSSALMSAVPGAL